MKIKEVYDIFSSFYDDIRDEVIIIPMFCRHINNAQMAILKHHFYPEKDPYRRTQRQDPLQSLGHTQYKDEDFKELFEPVTLNTDANGKVLFSAIDALFPVDTIQGEDGNYETTTCKYFHLSSAKRDGVKVVWQRHNDHSVEEENPFKSPTDRFPKLRFVKDGLVFLPEEEASIDMMVVRTPRHVWLDESTPANNIDPELSTSLMYDVIFRALTFAGVNIREAQIRDYAEREENKL